MPPDEKQLHRIAAFKEPHAFYVAGEDNLRITSLNSVAGVVVQLNGRMITLDGRVQPLTARHVPNTDRTAVSSIAPIGEGWIANLSAVVVTGAPLYGQTWIRVDVVRGLTGAVEPLATLMQGCITATQKIAFPGSEMYSTLERPGAIRTITGTNPAANTEVLETVPTGARWRLLALTVRLVNDATVANRLPILILDDGLASMAWSAVTSAMTAGAQWQATWGTYGVTIAPTSLGSIAALPDGLVLLAGHRIRTNTLNFQAGDEYGAPQLTVEEWLEGA